MMILSRCRERGGGVGACVACVVGMMDGMRRGVLFFFFFFFFFGQLLDWAEALVLLREFGTWGVFLVGSPGGRREACLDGLMDGGRTGFWTWFRFFERCYRYRLTD